jgi:hypothetical protein
MRSIGLFRGLESPHIHLSEKLIPSRHWQGGITLTGNTVMYSSSKNPAPRKVGDLGCAKVSFGSRLRHYTQLT